MVMDDDDDDDGDDLKTCHICGKDKEGMLTLICGECRSKIKQLKESVEKARRKRDHE